ncbi:MAG: thiamine pyrophosphate-dependent enzyme, partial [Desulfobacterales bacterium]
GYNMPGATVDGNDLLQVRQAAKTAVARARRGDGPSLLENRTYRIRGHFEGDPQKYRRPVDVETWQNDNDPITRFSRFLMRENVLTADLEKKIRDAVAVELTAAVEFAEQSPWPEPEQALEDLLV